MTGERQGEAQFLASYDPAKYPHVAVTVDVVLLTVRAGRLSVLLVQRDGHPYRGHWALPGGFVEPGDDLDNAARRELAEETGVLVAGGGHGLGHIEQLRSYGAPDRDPRMPRRLGRLRRVHRAQRARGRRLGRGRPRASGRSTTSRSKASAVTTA